MKISDVVVSLIINGYSGLFTAFSAALFPFLKNVDQRRKWDLVRRKKIPAAVREFYRKRVVWVHAASLGEAKLLCRFLSILEKRNPGDMYVVTAVTRTGVEFLEKNSPETVCAIGFFPIDTIPMIKKTIRQFNIKRVWLLETELWPSMLWTLRKLAVPVGIVNGRIERDSFARYWRFRSLLNYFFRDFDVVLAQNEIYAERFKALGVKQDCIHVVGNIKSYIPVKRPSAGEWTDTRQALGLAVDDLVISCGCVHAGEGKVIRQCFDILKSNGIDCKMIVVPRYLNEIPELIREIGGELAHLSGITASGKWELCVIEKMGILDDMYMIADAAIIGGTFSNVGGHNVWDAARFGIPVFFGPDYHTQVDGCEKLMSNGVGFKSGNGIELAGLIIDVLKKEPRKFIQAQLRFIEEFNQSQFLPELLLP